VRRGCLSRSRVDLRRATNAPDEVSLAAGSLPGNRYVTCAADACGGTLDVHTSEAGAQLCGQSDTGAVAPSTYDVKASRGGHWKCASRAGTSVAFDTARGV